MSDTNTPSTVAGEAGTGSDPRSGDDGRSGERWFDRLMAAVGLRPTTAALRESLEEVLSDEAAGDDAFSAEERALLRNILRLRETRVDDVMVPRSEVDAVADDITLADLMLAFARSAHSRMPVYRETLDDANAMVHIRDLMQYLTSSAQDADKDGLELSRVDLSVRLVDAGVMRPVLSVPATMPATDLLARMQAERIQMALVIDEFGGVDGLVSMEDIVETVVGDIEDEHDTDEGTPQIIAAGESAWSIDGLAEIAVVTEATGVNFAAVIGDDEEVETLGGVVFALSGHVPVPGEVLRSGDLPGIRLEVLDADARRVKRVLLAREEHAN